MSLDTGHFNCRDYDTSLHAGPLSKGERVFKLSQSVTFATLSRHESFDELEHRSRSPASMQPKFPLLSLPLELRQQIFSYLLPRTQELQSSNPLGKHARNFSAVQQRSARGMELPLTADTARASRQDAPSPVVWIRGSTALLAVCKQIHDEAAAMMYGQSTFLLFITFSDITFRFRWMLKGGLAPTRFYPNFLGMVSPKYLRLMRKIIINVDHVDSYTGMIKFNISGQGLVHGLRKQVQRLVLALHPIGEDDVSNRSLSKVIVKVSSSNATLDMIKTMLEDDVPTKPDIVRLFDDVKQILEPLNDLAGVNEVRITGAVPQMFAQNLERRMESNEPRERHAVCCDHGMSDRDPRKEFPLCVYGNDID